jgi:hypothetical protein
VFIPDPQNYPRGTKEAAAASASNGSSDRDQEVQGLDIFIQTTNS